MSKSMYIKNISDDLYLKIKIESWKSGETLSNCVIKILSEKLGSPYNPYHNEQVEYDRLLWYISRNSPVSKSAIAYNCQFVGGGAAAINRHLDRMLHNGNIVMERKGRKRIYSFVEFNENVGQEKETDSIVI